MDITTESLICGDLFHYSWSQRQVRGETNSVFKDLQKLQEKDGNEKNLSFQKIVGEEYRAHLEVLEQILLTETKSLGLQSEES